MRTNKFSSKKNLVKLVALVTLLFACFVFAFAMTYSFADVGRPTEDNVAFAYTFSGDKGVTTLFYGNNGDIAQSSFGITQASSGALSGTYTEYFSSTTFSYNTNLSIHTTHKTNAEYDFNNGVGTFSWEGDYYTTSYYDFMVFANYKVPTFIKQISSVTGVSVHVTFGANVVRNKGNGSGILLIVSDNALHANSVGNDNNAYQNYNYVAGTGDLTREADLNGESVLTLGFYGENNLSYRCGCTISNVFVKFDISFDDTIVSNAVNAEDINTSLQFPYRTTSGDSTWPVKYDSFASRLSTATDSMSSFPGKMRSYTNESHIESGVTYYKKTVVKYSAKNYEFVYARDENNNPTGSITFDVGIKTVQVGDNSVDITNLSTSTTINLVVSGVNVGKAKIEKNSRCEVTVTSYLTQNASVTTSVLDVGAASSAKTYTIEYSGIDATAPKALALGDHDAVTNNSANIASIDWWRNSLFSDSAALAEADTSNGTPYIWFYRVDKADSILQYTDSENANYLPARVYSSYAGTGGIKDAGLQPIAYESISNFEYDFNSGLANGGVNDPVTGSTTNATGVGYYRFTFWAVDLAGNISSSSTYYVKADYAQPTFKVSLNYFKNVGTEGWEEDYYNAVPTFDAALYNANPRWFEYQGQYVKIDSAHLYFKDGNNYVLVSPMEDYVGNMKLYPGLIEYYVKIGSHYELLTLPKICKAKSVSQSANGQWLKGDVSLAIKLTNGTSISGNTLIFTTDNGNYGIVFDDEHIIKRIETVYELVGDKYQWVEHTYTLAEPVNSLTYATKIETELDSITVTIEYDAANGEIVLTFPDGADALTGLYPTVDLRTSFTIFAGQNYEDDYSVQASDGWNGGVYLRIDRNKPETPTLILGDPEDEDSYLKAMGAFKTNIPVENRHWFTQKNLSFDISLLFNEPLLDEDYAADINVYIGIKNITSDADFEIANNIVYFYNNFSLVDIADYGNYFDERAVINGRRIDNGDENELAIALKSTLGPGMRVIFVWAVDQAGNCSETISKYYVLADDYTYTIASSVKSNPNLAANSAILTQTNSEEDVVSTFKRGDVIYFGMDISEGYAPYTFVTKDDDGNIVSKVLTNYTAEYAWTVAGAYDSFVNLADGHVVEYTLDATSIGKLSTIDSGTTRKLIFELAHRQVVDYTASYSSRYSATPVEVQMSTLAAAKSAYRFHFLDENGDSCPDGVGGNAPTLPGDYYVAIYIPSDNDNYVLSSVNNEYVLTPTAAPGEKIGSAGSYQFKIGYQIVNYLPFTIFKGLATISAKTTSSVYGEIPALDYDVTGLDKLTIETAGFTLKLNTSETGTLRVGEYQIIVDNAVEIENYEITYISAFHTIHKKQIHIATVSATKIYGDADPVLEFSVSLSEFADAAALEAFFANFGSPRKEGDVYYYSGQGAITREAGENANGDLKPYYAYIVDSFVFDVDQNYTLTAENVATFTITKRTVNLNVEGQYLVKKGDFNPADAHGTIVPTFTLSAADEKFAGEIAGHLAFADGYTDRGPDGDYDHRYQYTITIGTIANSNMIFNIVGTNTFDVYVVEDAIIISLKSAIEFTYGLQWYGSSSIVYSGDNFEGLPALEEGKSYAVTWTASIKDKNDGTYLEAGSYLVKISGITVNVMNGNDVESTLNKVFVDPFNITVKPAIIKVAPTCTAFVKGYGDSDSVFGIGFEVVSINGEPVGSTFAGKSVDSEIIPSIVSGAYARALFGNGDVMIAIGTRNDDASDSNGVLYCDNTKYYGLTIGTSFRTNDANFVVDAELSSADLAKRFEITRATITIDKTDIVGISRTKDGTNTVRYGDTQIADIRSQLVFSTDDVAFAASSAVYTSVELDPPAETPADEDPSEKTITLSGFQLVGAKAANYIIVVKDGLDVITSATISFIDNKNEIGKIYIREGTVIINQIDVTIKKQYDGTDVLRISDVSIARNENNALLVECLEGGKAVLESGNFNGATAVSQYPLDIVIFFPFDNPEKIVFENVDANAQFDDGYAERGNLRGKVLRLKNVVNSYIVPKVINYQSFATLTPDNRDYNSTGAVTVTAVLKDGVFVGSEHPTVTINAQIDGVNYGKGLHNISFVASPVKGAAAQNYTVDVDDLNNSCPQEKKQVQIYAAKLLPNVNFVAREYNGVSLLENSEIEGGRDGSTRDFTTLNFANELATELAAFEIGVGVTYSLSDKGELNANVMIDGDGNVLPHNILVHGLSVHDTTSSGLLENYTVYGVRYNNDLYESISETIYDSNAVADYELRGAIEISKKVINISSNNIIVHDKVYDGTRAASATIKVNELDDVVAADRDHLIISATGLFDQKYVSASPIDVKINVPELRADSHEYAYLVNNYVVGSISGVNIQKYIYARPVTFSATLGSKVYNADEGVSDNIIRYTIGTAYVDEHGNELVKWGELEKEKNTYGIQTLGGAYFIDKNVAFVADDNGKFKAEISDTDFAKSPLGTYKKVADEYVEIPAGDIDTFDGDRYAPIVYYIALTETELSSYTGQRYIIGSKQGTLYNPTLKNTKSQDIMNYVLTYAVERSAGYIASGYRYCELSDGSIAYYDSDSIKNENNPDTDNVVTYFFAIDSTDKYIAATEIFKLYKAREHIVGFYKVNIGTEADPDYLDAYLVDNAYTGVITDTLAAPVTYSNDAKGTIRQLAAVINNIKQRVYTKYILESNSAKVDAARAANAIIDEVYVIDIDSVATNVYRVVDSFTGAVDGELADADVRDVYTRPYDGTTKFYGLSGIDYTYNEAGIGKEGDDLYIVGVSAEFESATVGNTYVVVKAEKLGGADANNYTYGTLRTERLRATIDKISITASLANGTMVYGTNLSSLKGDITYTINGFDLELSDAGVMIKYTEFLKAVGLVATLGDDVDASELPYMSHILAKLYTRSNEGVYTLVEYNAAEYETYYVCLSQYSNITLPKVRASFTLSRPKAGDIALSYTLDNGDAKNFKYILEYTGDSPDGKSSRLEVLKKDMYVVAAVKDYEKEYGAETPLVNLNYFDKNGNEGRASGESIASIFGSNTPRYWFSAFENGATNEQPISATAMVNSDERFNGDYVLIIKGAEGFDAEHSNYNVHFGTVVYDSVAGEYRYVFAGSSFTATVPMLTIKMPTLSGVGMATKEGDAYITTYSGNGQTTMAVVFAGGKDGDIYSFVGDKNEVLNAGEYNGEFILTRPVVVDEYDTNGYALTWSTKVDGGQDSVKLVVNKASSNLRAPRDSVRYDGTSHVYNVVKAMVDDNLSPNEDYFSQTYAKKVKGNYYPVDEMRDAGSYVVYLHFDPHNSNYEDGNIEIQYSITKASVVVDLDYAVEQLYESDKGYSIGYSIRSIAPSKDERGNAISLLTNDDLMVQILVGGEAMFKIENGAIKAVDESVVKMENGKFVFGNSGRYPFQVVLKDSSKKDNFDITQSIIVSGKQTATTATGTLELVVTKIDFAEGNDVKASLELKQEAGQAQHTLLTDKFEVKYVYKNNVSSADDDAYYAAIDEAFMPAIEKELNTSVTITTIIRMNLYLGGQKIDLSSPTTVSVELTPELLNSLDGTAIYRTVLNDNGTTRLEKLTDYKVEDGMLIFETDTLGSLVFVKAGRETPMLAVWIGTGVAGAAALIVLATGLYIGLKKRRLKKELLD